MGLFSSVGKLLDNVVAGIGGGVAALLVDSECRACGAVFWNRQEAESHVRKVHLKH